MPNSIKRVLVSLIFACLLFLQNPIQAQNTNQIGVKVSPAILEYNVMQGEKIKDQIKFEVINSSDKNIEVKFLEASNNSAQYEPSDLFQDITKIKYNPDRKIFDIHIDTNDLIDKTYFFGISFFLNNIKENSGQKENLNVIIPVILTVNKNKESINPIPQYSLEVNRNVVFSREDLQIHFVEKNNSSKVIRSGGEIIILAYDGTILYSEGVSAEKGKLLPGAIHSKIISPPTLVSQYTNSLPYIGKIKIYYRGTINYERHIETPFKEVYIIPWQYIVFSVTMALTIYLILRILKRKKQFESDMVKYSK